jgi:hypothetical protein
MTFKRFISTTGILVLLVSCADAKAPNSSNADPESGQTLPLIAKGDQSILKSGQFTSAEHQTLGKATIFSSKGKTILELDSSFQTDDGPDLFVLLHQDATPSSYTPPEFETVSQLKRTSGLQQYEIPTSWKLEKYNSIVIWCKKFDVTFGYASLN